MGFLRFLLALLVVIDHACWHFKLMPSPLAVACFFAVSGFYMQLVIPTYYKKDASWQLAFYKSRALRIYPAYLFFLICTIWVSYYQLVDAKYMMRDFFNTSYSLDFPYYLVYLFNNIFILGLEFYRFLIYDPLNHALTLAPFAHFNVQTAGSHFIVIGQAWSISSELFFYLGAPFVLMLRSKWLVLIVVISFAIRLSFHQLGWANEQVTDSFLLNNFGLFLVGALSYRFLYIPLNQYQIDEKKLQIYYWIASFCLIVAFASFFSNLLISTDFIVKKWLYFSVIVFLMPFLFYCRKASAFDRYIGDLSYPIYLGHMLILALVKTYFPKHFSPLVYELFILVATILLTVLVSALVVKYIEYPLDRYRHRRYGKPEHYPNQKNEILCSILDSK